MNHKIHPIRQLNLFFFQLNDTILCDQHDLIDLCGKADSPINHVDLFLHHHQDYYRFYQEECFSKMIRLSVKENVEEIEEELPMIMVSTSVRFHLCGQIENLYL